MNYNLFQLINQFAGRFPVLDGLMVVISQVSLHIYALILIIMWFYRKENYKHTVVFATMTGIAGLVTNFIISHIYFEPRPFVTHDDVQLLFYHAADASFPSDHTTGAFALSLFVYLCHRKIGSAMIILAVFTGISRIYVGHHYPYDVLGSIMIALTASLFIFKIRKYLSSIPKTLIFMFNRIPFVAERSQGEKKE
ncbi:undecaprenyl-diphosphatase [Domibacillus sp. PGB-M46]|uniref:undecaprenyl-diphosphatase n=1 Tax=Domibacillus sp. PGB-M46 TaxID=2910255 RepID=UPI001F591C19|nr:undecaprenyl-diphosphatase [Domibacillus sp. PGB-M46]MCI2255225.1 undecaprenyl-diphosphatase [Domibacillus sp. PGB-M46]